MVRRPLGLVALPIAQCALRSRALAETYDRPVRAGTLQRRGDAARGAGTAPSPLVLRPVPVVPVSPGAGSPWTTDGGATASPAGSSVVSSRRPAFSQAR